MQMEDMITADEFCSGHHLEISFIHALHQQGMIETAVISEMVYIPRDELFKLEQIVRLHQELEINFEGIDAITHLLQRIENLHMEITVLKNRLKFYEEENG